MLAVRANRGRFDAPERVSGRVWGWGVRDVMPQDMMVPPFDLLLHIVSAFTFICIIPIEKAAQSKITCFGCKKKYLYLYRVHVDVCQCENCEKIKCD